LVLSALVGSDGFKTVWQGEPVETTAPPALPTPTSQPGVCQRWKSAAGDPGWAGVLVERALNKETTWVIAPAGTDILGLFAEALALAGPAQRWQIPFTTYSLNRNEGRWLGTLAGTPEADAARKLPKVLVVDLANPGLPPTAGPYVQAARGIAPPPWARINAAAERVLSAQPHAGAVTARMNTPSLPSAAARPEMAPPPIHAQSGLPPTLKQWPGALPEPKMPWYTSAAACCIAGALLIAGSLYVAYQTVARTSRPAPDEVAATVDTPPKQKTVEVEKEDDGNRSQADEERQSREGEMSDGSIAQDEQNAALKVNESNGFDEDSSSNKSSDAHALSLPHVIDQIAEVAVGHKPHEAVNIAKNGQEAAAVVVLRWPRESTSLRDLVLSIPAVGDGESRFVLNVKPLEANAGDAAPQVIWECRDSLTPSMPLGTFTVGAKELLFTLSNSESAIKSLADLSLMPLFFTYARDPTKRHWVALGKPAQALVFVSSHDGDKSSSSGVAIHSDPAETLISHVALKGGTLTLPAEAVGQGCSEGSFSQSLGLAEGTSPTRFRWRPVQWAMESGAWMPGTYSHKFDKEDSSLSIQSHLQLEHADCLSGAPPEQRTFARRRLQGTLNVPVDKWKRLVEEAFVCGLMRENDLHVPESRNPQSLAQLEKDVFLECEQEMDSLLAGVLEEWNSEPISFVGHSEQNDKNKSRWCPRANAVITLDMWIDSLKRYLVAYRALGEVRLRPIPAKPEVLGLQSSDVEKKRHDDLVAARQKRIEEVKAVVMFGGNAAAHEWCEQVISSDSEPDFIRQVARLWVLFNNLQAEVRGGVSSSELAKTVCPNVSGEIVVSFPRAGEDVEYPLAVLEQRAGALSSVLVPQDEVGVSDSHGDDEQSDEQGVPAESGIGAGAAHGPECN
jgi:hypothetical protein